MKVQIVYFQHLRLPLLSNRKRNNGPPRKDVIAPIGNIIGEIAILAKRSLNSKINDPAIVDPGIR